MIDGDDRCTAAAEEQHRSVTGPCLDSGRRDALARIAKAAYAAPVTIALLNAQARAGS